MKTVATMILCAILSFPLAGQQNSKLADQYYLDGEYEKAADLYEALYQQSNRGDYYFAKYIECLLAMEEYARSESIIQEQIDANPTRVSLYVTLGNVLERQNKYEEAETVFHRAIDNLTANAGEITVLGNSFLQLTKYDLAIEAYEKGQKLLNRPGLYANNLADLYRRKGDTERMIENYLYSLQANPERLAVIQTTLQRYLHHSDYDLLQAQLYNMMQDYPEADHFPEMLAWVFVQKRDFDNALRQMKALDRRLNENGHRVYRLARMAENAKEFDVAIEGYDYIVNEKGSSSAFYLDSKRRSLANQRERIVQNYDYTQEELRSLEQQYNDFLSEIGRNQATAPIIAELAQLQAFYINDLEAAIALLEDVIEYPGVNPKIRAQAKLDLADFQLMNGEIWEATLLYSQVDKEFKEDLLGQEARFRNAKLSYYNGDFEWAQAQFDILKASTSKLIANDALDLSVFIMDNLGLDTTAHPLTMYSQADMLLFQNRLDEAEEKLQILSNLYPDHGLQDDILYLRAQIKVKRRAYREAAGLYTTIVEEYPEEIRADNALFALARLYEEHLDDPMKAQELYEKLFIDYSGSTFSIEARKRFRILRGDFEGSDPVN